MAEQDGLSAKDPVCRMAVDPSVAKWRHDHAGQTYYFCGQGCLTRFIADPAGYLTTARPDVSRAPAPAVDVAAEYFCPMDPQVISDRPGACPKCGMALQPRILTAADAACAADPELRDMTRRCLFSAAFTVPLMLLTMSAEMSATVRGWLAPQLIAWLELGLATPVVGWGAAPFFKRGAQSVLNRKLNMFTLIALGVGIAYGASVATLLFPAFLGRAADNPMGGGAGLL